MSSSQQVPAKKQQGMCSSEGEDCLNFQPLRYLSSHFHFAEDISDLQTTYSNFKNTLQQIASKIGDIEQEAEEHKLVLETLEPLAEDRKCFRLINGVLVERTVKDVVPALQTNQEGLKKVLDDLVKQYKNKQDELDKWKVCLFPIFKSQQPANVYASCQQKKNNVQVVQQ
ncbi:hypothetical protein MKX08_010338 [Trichoderma sp. CBMAI-0020]|nr:hypothetical protein MKX08_010338 [Trichoderma sp. CBMAI-0020]